MSQFLRYAETLLRRPTAPYREQWVLEVLDEHLRGFANVESRVDRFGNRWVRIRRGNPKFAPVALVAHMDHPGFVVTKVEPGGRRVHAAFEGGVNDGFFLGGAVRLFRSATDAGVRAKIVEAGTRGDGPRGNRRIVLDAQDDATGAVLGMWDLVPFDLREGVLHSRAVDDIVGVSMILESARRVAESKDDADLIILFTRAEECGFRGALCLALEPNAHEFLPKDAWVLSVETSSARPTTPVGGGAVLRVGDKSTMFDPEVSGAVADVSEQLAQDGHRGLRRALMDGGTCEGSVFVLYGWRAGGVCVPLGNYHNMNQETKRIEAEYVALQDCEDLISAMARLGQGGIGGPTLAERLREEFAELADTARDELVQTQAPGPRPQV